MVLAADTMGYGDGGTALASASCIRPDREARFAAGVGHPHVDAFPHAAICKILVLQRVSALASCGIVDETGEPVDRPRGEHDPGPEPEGPWGSIRPEITALIQGEGTGFWVRDRIVTAAHVVLGATVIMVIAAKNGPGVAAPGTAIPDEPLGRQRLSGSAVRVFPRAIRVATLPSPRPDDFFAHDLAVLRPVPPPPGHPVRPPGLGAFDPAPPPRAGECVNTSGYSAETVDRNVQHTDVGVCTRRRGNLVDYDLMSEKGASGSPIWKGPFVPPRAPIPGAPVCGIVLGGSTRHETTSLVFDGPRRDFVLRA